MAFSDVIDKANADAFLVAVIEPKTVTGGAANSIGISERYVIAPDVIPGGSGDRKYNGIVESWGDFGYVGQATPPAFIVSDGSVVLSSLKGLGPYASLSALLSTYELHGARTTIAQCIEDSTTSSGYAARVFFSGYVTEATDLTAETATLQFTDPSLLAADVPPTEVTRVAFPDAPDDSIGCAIPVIYGDFSEVSDYTGITAATRQLLGAGNMAGVPCVTTDKHVGDEYNRGPDYRIASHRLKELDTAAGAALLEPGEEVPGQVPDADWALAEADGYSEIRTVWPFHAVIPIRADKRGTLVMSPQFDYLNACDGDPETVAVVDPTGGGWGYLQLIPRNVGQLGTITEVRVAAWVAAGGHGSVRVGLQKGGSWYGTSPYTDFALTGNEQVCIHSVVSTAWANEPWNFDQYELTLANPALDYAAVREMVLLVTYIPCRKVVARPGPFHGWRELRHWERYHEPSSGDEQWPSHGPTVLAYPKGVKDDVSGTYTGSASALIENAADIAHHVAAIYGPGGAAGAETDGGIGDFAVARTALGVHHKLAVPILETRSATQVFEDICKEARAMPVYNSSGRVGMVVINSDPMPDYRTTGDPYQWEPGRDFYENTFKCWRTPISELANRVYIEFDYCPGTGKFRRTAFITPEATDNGFGTDDDAARKLKAGYGEARFGKSGEFRLKAYDVRKQGVAKKLRNFYFDTLWRPRVSFEFQTGVHACDLSVGNVIMFSGEVHTINGWALPNPDVTSKNWSGYYWYVTGATRMESAGDASRILIRATEAVIPPSANDWIAAADDTP